MAGKRCLPILLGLATTAVHHIISESNFSLTFMQHAQRRSESFHFSANPMCAGICSHDVTSCFVRAGHSSPPLKARNSAPVRSARRPPKRSGPRCCCVHAVFARAPTGSCVGGRGAAGRSRAASVRHSHTSHVLRFSSPALQILFVPACTAPINKPAKSRPPQEFKQPILDRN